jgi:hypothetical protein
MRAPMKMPIKALKSTAAPTVIASDQYVIRESVLRAVVGRSEAPSSRGAGSKGLALAKAVGAAAWCGHTPGRNP